MRFPVKLVIQRIVGALYTTKRHMKPMFVRCTIAITNANWQQQSGLLTLQHFHYYCRKYRQLRTK